MEDSEMNKGVLGVLEVGAGDMAMAGWWNALSYALKIHAFFCINSIFQ